MAITEVKLGKVPKYQEDPETGEKDYTKTPVLVDEVEVRATGKDVNDPTVVNAFKQISWKEQNQRANRRKKFGVLKITDPQGNVGEIFQHEEEKYKSLGWGQKATKLSFVNSFGEQRLNSGGYRKIRYKYIDGKLVETYRKEIS